MSGHWTVEHREAQAKRCREQAKSFWKNIDYRKKQIAALQAGLARRWAKKGAKLAQAKVMARQNQDGDFWETLDSKTRKKLSDTRSSNIKKYNKKLHYSPKLRKARHEAKKASSKYERMKKKLSDAMKRRMENPKYASMVRASRGCPTKPQRSLLRKLCRAGISGFVWEHPVVRYSLDVANPKLKICVELDGEYWHNFRKEQDKKRDKLLRKRGWQVKRFSANRIGIRRAFEWVVWVVRQEVLS